MLVEGICGDDEILAPCGLPCEPHRALRAVEKALPVPGVYLDLACNDDGHVIVEEVRLPQRPLVTGRATL